MPDKETIERAHQDAAQGKSASTQAGEFVREEMHHIREGKHGARSPKQAIAIGLSKARRAGVKLGAPKRGTASAATRRKAARDVRRGRSRRRPSARRARAVRGAQRCGEEGGQDEGPGQAPRGSPQGGTDAQGALVPDGESGYPDPSAPDDCVRLGIEVLLR